MAKLFLLLGTINAGLCVVLGAFAAHKLKILLSESALTTFQVGVQYHFYHSLALIVLALLMLQLELQHSSLRYSGFAFFTGIILFSGSLYGLSLASLSDASWKFLGPITPLGGLAFIVAWILMSIGVYKSL